MIEGLDERFQISTSAFHCILSGSPNEAAYNTYSAGVMEIRIADSSCCRPQLLFDQIYLLIITFALFFLRCFRRVYKWRDFDPTIVFSGTLKLAIQAACSQQNCGGATDAKIVTPLLSRQCRTWTTFAEGKFRSVTPSFNSHLLSQVFEVDHHFKMIVTTQIYGNF